MLDPEVTQQTHPPLGLVEGMHIGRRHLLKLGEHLLQVVNRTTLLVLDIKFKITETASQQLSV